ncbi:MAG: hypothetical protein LBQ77_08015 [Treponema sp.]|jgi:hypothetical protein|nr:hypothetical protein [Treponema sp.]
MNQENRFLTDGDRPLNRKTDFYQRGQTSARGRLNHTRENLPFCSMRVLYRDMNILYRDMRVLYRVMNILYRDMRVLYRDINVLYRDMRVLYRDM